MLPPVPRRELHQLLGLPDNRPALRPAMALVLGGAGAKQAGPATQRLRNVHVGLTPPGKALDAQRFAESVQVHWHQ